MGEKSWHLLDEKEILIILDSSEKGFSTAEAEKRINQFGENEIVREKKQSLFQMFLRQFKSFLIIILLIAAIISLAVGEMKNAIVITIILLANATLGFFQEFKAEKAIEALKKLTSPRAIALRDGVKKEVYAKDLIPGDIIYLDEGRKVPADIRITDSSNLKADESLLTGESLPVSKNNKVFSKDVQISEISNMVFFGTHITQGEGKGIVVRTGMDTEMGNIAKMVQETAIEDTPLKKKLDTLGKNMGVFVLIIVAVVFFLNFHVHSRGALELFMLAIALAVSAVPEGLPMIVTLTLSLGMQAMAKENAVVRKLMAVETLGATNIICSDKTGTLTKNEMTVMKLFLDKKYVKVTGTGYAPDGEFHINGSKINPLTNPSLKTALKISILCNNASLLKEEEGWTIVGDPTEGALVTLAQKGKISRDTFEDKERIQTTMPFSSERKMMSSVYKSGNKLSSYVKGAPEKVIKNSTHFLENGKIKKMDSKTKKLLEKTAEDMASEPLRVLALAYKEMPLSTNCSIKTTETELVFVGFAGMIDPPREGVLEAIRTCKEAGIKTVMITGDHKTTAVAIAEELGIINKGEIAVTGVELDAMSVEELEAISKKVSVYARTSPEHKVKIVQALESQEYTIAMTGDGVNDAPALKRAHIGVAMGLKGTDVAKEASDMVLQDDNFSTIVRAVENGRRIYDNIKKFVRFELASNMSEVAAISFAAIVGMPLPLIPLQILWINLVTDTMPATALAVDPAEKDTMKKQPRPREENIIRSMLPFLATVIVVMGAIAIWVFYWGMQFGIERARTIVFTTIVMFKLLLVFNCRSETKPLLMTNPFNNKFLGIAVICSFLLQLGVIYLAPLQVAFGTVPLVMEEWIVIILFSLIALAITPALFNVGKKSHNLRNVNSKNAKATLD